MKQKKFLDPPSEPVEEEEASLWNRGKIIIWLALSIAANWCSDLCLDVINNKRRFIWAASVIVIIVI
nr:MAG TPA: hypothetical protein [Caudoviricetes sp.]